MRVELRERSFGELVGQSFTLTVTHFCGLLAIIVPFSLPVLALEVMELGAKHKDESGLLTIAIILAQLLVSPITQGASVLLVAASFTGASPTLGEGFSAALRRFWPLLLVGAGVAIVVGVGLVLLIVPGLVFLTWYYMAGPALMVEELSWREAMGRSKSLSQGSRMELLGFVVVTGLLLQMIPMLSIGLLPAIAGNPTEGVLGVVLMWLVEVVVSTVGVVAPVVYYFNQRVRREGFDLEALASLVDSIGRRRPAVA